jgi:predicted 2-oxoglutarate/Fe(II)-dependent dioxygenase YbiX
VAAWRLGKLIDTLLIKNFLDPETLRIILEGLLLLEGDAATVYSKEASGSVDLRVRSAAQINPSSKTRELVMSHLRTKRPDVENHFGVSLSECEEPQFLRYQKGGFFVAHQDGNTPLIRDDSRFRKISVVIFLNPQSEEPASNTYGGGSLLLHGPYPHFDVRVPVECEPGSLIAFRAETTHEVTPVTHGERYTIVSWYR